MDTGTTVIYIQKTIYQNNKCVYNCITKYTLNEKTQVNIFLFYIYIAIGWVVDLNHSFSISNNNKHYYFFRREEFFFFVLPSCKKQKFPKNL